MTAPGARRLAQALVDMNATQPDGPVGRVKDVVSGVITVRFDGADLRMPYLASYTPVVGDQVALARHGGRWLALGLPTGIPT